MLVGGSGFYIWAVLEGWIVPKVAPDVFSARDRKRERNWGRRDELYRELNKIDPVAAGKIDPHNVRRVIRALEVNKTSDSAIFPTEKKQAPPFQTLIIGLTAGREELYRRADERADNMLGRALLRK